MKKLSLALIAALVCLCSCQGDDTNDNKKSGGEGKEDEELTDNGLGIVIDGSFEDWAAVDPTKVASASTDPDGLWDAVKQIKVCADQDFVYFYFEYDKDSVEELLEGDKLPIRLCLNVDGEFTSGYSNYFLQSYDFIIEGSVGAEGEFIDFDGTLHQRIEGAWAVALSSGNSLVSGKGAGNQYEICLIKEIFNGAAAKTAVPMQMGDVFQAGIRFYTSAWGELSNMPNGAVTDDNTEGWGNMLTVTSVN